MTALPDHILVHQIAPGEDPTPLVLAKAQEYVTASNDAWVVKVSKPTTADQLGFFPYEDRYTCLHDVAYAIVDSTGNVVELVLTSEDDALKASSVFGA